MSTATLNEAQSRMKKAVEHTLHEFSTIHTGKASPAMVESIQVEAYGSMMPLKGLRRHHHARSAHDPVQPWDKGLLRAIEKALQMANIGVNPIVDGSLIRLPFPDLSRERRQEFVKTAHRLAEEGRVSVRHIRRDAMEGAKKLKKDGKISEDDEKRLEKDVQTATDKAIKDIDTHLASKEKDLLTV
ncbi:MAG: ribosome recycling factor [Lacunisphaera sp.]